MGILAKRQSEEAQVEHLEDTMNRQAGALAEVQRIHADNMRMHDLAERNRREIERLEYQCHFLKEELSKAQQEGKVYQRKLIRLADAMSGMSRLAQDGDEIVKSTQEWDEVIHESEPQKAAEKAEDEKALAAIVESLPRGHD